MPVGGLKKKLKKKQVGADPSSPSVEKLVERANACLDELPPDVARALEFFEHALRLDSNNTTVLDAFGALLCEEGSLERAAELFKRSISLDPQGGFDNYFYLAQMEEGREALVHYKQGVDVLLKRISSAKLGEDTNETMPEQSKLASVQASIAELWMTELCDEPDAEDECEAALTSGFEADPKCLELLVAKMALRKVQGLLDESKEVGLACLQLFKEASASTDPYTLVPSDEACIALCRALIDLTLVEEAREILMVLLEQDDEDIQVWYLLACSHLVEKEVAAVKECAKRGLELCKQAGHQADDWKEPLRKVLAEASQLPVDAAEDADADRECDEEE